MGVKRGEKQLKSKEIWGIAKQFGLKDEAQSWMGNKLISRMSPIVKSLYFKQKFKYSSPADAVLGIQTFENEMEFVNWETFELKEM